MPYLSELTGHTVADVDGERIGRLDDLVAVVPQDLSHPKIVALVVKRAGGPLLIPLADVVVLFAPAVALNKRLADITPYQPSEHDLYLTRDVLDKQIIDTDGVRVVRVNDLESGPRQRRLLRRQRGYRRAGADAPHGIGATGREGRRSHGPQVDAGDHLVGCG